MSLRKHYLERARRGETGDNDAAREALLQAINIHDAMRMRAIADQQSLESHARTASQSELAHGLAVERLLDVLCSIPAPFPAEPSSETPPAVQ